MEWTKTILITVVIFSIVVSFLNLAGNKNFGIYDFKDAENLYNQLGFIGALVNIGKFIVSIIVFQTGYMFIDIFLNLFRIISIIEIIPYIKQAISQWI